MRIDAVIARRDLVSEYAIDMLDVTVEEIRIRNAFDRQTKSVISLFILPPADMSDKSVIIQQDFLASEPKPPVLGRAILKI